MSLPRLTDTRKRALMLIYLTDEDLTSVQDVINTRLNDCLPPREERVFGDPHLVALGLDGPVVLQGGIVIPRYVSKETYRAIRRGYTFKSESGAWLKPVSWHASRIRLKLTPRAMYRIKCQPEFEELRALKCMRLL